MFRERLWAAFGGLVFWLIMYKTITDTQLFEINAAFWPRFVFVGLGVAGLCAWRGITLTITMMLHTLVFTVSGVLLIWLLWPYLPLGEILPVPEARWELWERVPALHPRIYYVSLCYTVALPLAICVTFSHPALVVVSFGLIGGSIVTLDSAIDVYQFVISQEYPPDNPALAGTD